jgi:multicomponent Na+:H+ antiporter subunit B
MLLGLFVSAIRDLPAFGHYRGPYGDVLNRETVYERHVTDVVTAVNFDWRGIDTLGEESILFLSVVGVAVLLRNPAPVKRKTGHTDSDDASPEREIPLPSEATRVVTLGLVGPLVVFGLYMVTHGHLTPGGGFQGGVILATAPLLVYLAGDLKTFQHMANHQAIEVVEALGLGGFLCLGLPGMITGGSYLRNVLALGTTGDVFSGGMIPLINVCTGAAVGSGLVMVIYSFLEHTLEVRLRGNE